MIRLKAVEIESVISRDLPKHRNVAGDDRQVMARSLDQWQPESFVKRRSQKRTRGIVQFRKYLIASLWQPDQIRMLFPNTADTGHDMLDRPALPAHNDQPDVSTLFP